MPRLSRRKIVAGMGSVPLLTQAKLAKVVEADPVLLLCAHYGDLLRRQQALMRRWGDHEAWLAKHYNWFSLSDEEQRAVPEGRALDTIDEEFDRCIREGVRVMRRLRSVPALTVSGAAAKLSVAAEAMEPDDYPSARGVLLSAIDDLRALSRRSS